MSGVNLSIGEVFLKVANVLVMNRGEDNVVSRRLTALLAAVVP